MNRRINVEEVCRAYNNARDENKGRTGSPSWASKVLKGKGLSVNMIRRILHEPTLIIYSKRENAGKGNYKGCTFPCDPIHKSWFENWLYPKRSNNTLKESISKEKDDFEVQCKKYLEDLGYTVRKFVFSEKMLKEKYPEIWEECLIEDDSI